MNSHVDKPKAQLENLSIRPCSVDDLETLSGLEAVTNLTTEGGGVGLLIGADGVALDVIGNVHRMFDVMVQGGTCNVYDSLLSVRTGGDAVIFDEKGVTGIDDAQTADFDWAQGAVSALDGRVSVLELNCDPHTTTADTTTVLAATAKRQQLISGSAAMQVYQLPDATTLVAGKCFVLVNASSEFVGIVNSSRALWHRVPPRAKCECWLIDNSTAAGTWHSAVIQDKDPTLGYDQFVEFVEQDTGNNIYGPVGLAVFKNGTGSTAGSQVSARNGRQGAYRYVPGTTATGYSGAASSNQYDSLAGACRAIMGSVCLSQLSCVTDEFILRFGMGDNAAGGAHTKGIYLLYDRATYGDVWVMRNINGSGNNTIATAVAPVVEVGGVATTWQKLRIEHNSSMTRTDFFIDNVQVSPAGGLATYLPNGATDYVRLANFGITSTVGTGAGRQLDIEYLRVQAYLATRR